jgi:hypothetical protein
LGLADTTLWFITILEPRNLTQQAEQQAAYSALISAAATHNDSVLEITVDCETIVDNLIQLSTSLEESGARREVKVWLA